MSTDSSFVCAALGISGSSSSSPSSSPECLVKQPQGPHTSSISYNFVPDFFQACDQDATQVALDLVQASLHDKRRRSLLELFAKRMLQELMLAETTTTTMAVNTNKVPTNLPTPPKYTFSAPYSKDVHAEMGDSGFEIFRELMRPIECLELGLHRRIPRPSQDAKRILGESIANAAIPIYQQLQNSFILYSPSWKTTTNQDTKTSSIPDDLLLVMLPYQKLPHADSNILHKIVTDFECSEILKAALDDWGLENEFSSLYQNYTNVGRSKASLKCLVFVARAYKCMYALQWTDIRDSLAGKVLQCLEILQQNISQPSSSAPPLKKKPRYTWDPPSTNNKKRHITKYHPAPVVWTAVPSCSSKILTDQDVAQLSRSEIMNMPVEKLCLETGRMLENFATAEEARRSVTNSDFQQPFVEVLKGNYRGGRVYKEFYWRLQDTHNSPLDEEQSSRSEMRNTPVEKDRLVENFATAEEARRSVTNPDFQQPFTELLKGKYPSERGTHDSQGTYHVPPKQQDVADDRSRRALSDRSWSELKCLPVEKLCLQTGRVLESFATAEAACQSVMDTRLDADCRYATFMSVLNGRYGAQKRVCRGYFWRLKGTYDTPLSSSPP